jgi:uncharacterized membrane protein
MDTQESRPPNSRMVAALSYVGFLVTGIILLYVEPYNQDDFIRFHARQSIVFSIAWIAVYIVVSVFIAVMPHPIAALLLFVLRIFDILMAIFWVFLMYQAYSGERYRIPELADWADSLKF